MPLPELLEGIIDYAGLFPPAKLSMPEAVRAYLRYTDGKPAWIVDKFLCPAGRLQELARELEGKDVEGLPVGVIATTSSDYETFMDALEEDAKSMTWFQEYADIVSYEAKLPAGVEVETAANDLRGFDSVDVFLELPWGPEQGDQISAVAGSDWLGAKARTGGLTAADFPSSESLAGFLKEVQDLNVPFKLTAGLHEPIRHLDEGSGAWHHGFLNVLTALAMNEDYDLSRSEMAEILDATKLEFPDGSIRWAGETAEGEGVRDVFCGFGSCSIEEPLAGLSRLGISGEAAR